MQKRRRSGAKMLMERERERLCAPAFGGKGNGRHNVNLNILERDYNPTHLLKTTACLGLCSAKFKFLVLGDY